MPYKTYLTKDAPSQSLEEAQSLPTPLGSWHLHYAHRDGKGRWVLRQGRGPLCGTPRCRTVFILEQEPVDFLDFVGVGSSGPKEE